MHPSWGFNAKSLGAPPKGAMFRVRNITKVIHLKPSILELYQDPIYNRDWRCPIDLLISATALSVMLFGQVTSLEPLEVFR